MAKGVGHLISMQLLHGGSVLITRNGHTGVTYNAIIANVLITFLMLNPEYHFKMAIFCSIPFWHGF